MSPPARAGPGEDLLGGWMWTGRDALLPLQDGTLSPSRGSELPPLLSSLSIRKSSKNVNPQRATDEPISFLLNRN